MFYFINNLQYMETHLCDHDETDAETGSRNGQEEKFPATGVLKEGGIHVGDGRDQSLLVHKLWKGIYLY